MAENKDVWVLLDFQKNFNDPDSILVFKSIMDLVKHGIYRTRSDGKKLKYSYAAVRKNLSINKYWRTEKFLIVGCNYKKPKK